MEQNEVRIGNWSLDAKGEWIQLTADDLSAIENFRPIKLSPEVLERFGFEFEQNFARRFIDQNRHTAIQIYPDGLVKLFSETFVDPADIDLPKNTVYLHQLQNLFFSLTGEELKSNED